VADVTTTGWGGRIGKAIVGIPVGIILFLVSFVVIFWNEGRAVHRAEALEEGKANCVEVADVSKVNPENNGKLVHMTGEAATGETIKDPVFNVSAPALKLTRSAEIYQWVERSESKTERKGTQDVTTTYYYHDKKWVKEPVDSSKFHSDDGGNTDEVIKNVGTLPYKDDVVRAKDAHIGGYKLTDHQVDQMGAGEQLPVTTEMEATLPDKLKGKVKAGQDGDYYQPRAGDDTTKRTKDDPSLDPQIGDVRYSFHVVKPATISLVYKQNGDTFEPYTAKSGSVLDLLVLGQKSAQEMFAAEEQANVTMTWILRLVGLVMMAAGIFLVLNPIAAFVDILPVFRQMASAVIGLFAILVALPLTLITIAIGWLFYRPLLGIGLLVVAFALLGGAFYFVRKVRASKGVGKRRDDDDEDARPRHRRPVDDEDDR
jgi:hypothetical protein